MTIGVVAKLEIKPDQEEAFVKAFTKLQSEVRANESGCLQYDLFKANGEGCTYVVLEQYADQAALDAHGQSDHFKAAQPALGTSLAGAPQLDFLGKIG